MLIRCVESGEFLADGKKLLHINFGLRQDILRPVQFGSVYILLGGTAGDEIHDDHKQRAEKKQETDGKHGDLLEVLFGM